MSTNVERLPDADWADSLVTQCATHPQVSTSLRCGKCGTPICPQCLVYTPVGTRCRSCAQLRRLPIFVVSNREYAAAIGVGLLSAVGVGTLWGLFGLFMRGFLGLLLAAAAGYTIGEVMSLTTNRKRSIKLQVSAGLMVVIASLISHGALLTLGPLLSSYPGLVTQPGLIGSLVLTSFLAILASPLSLLSLALAVYMAVGRFR